MADQGTPHAGTTATPVVWLASEEDLPAAAGLLGEFRDWFGNSVPADDRMLASVRRIAAAGDEYLLGGDELGRPQGVLQLRYRPSVWTDADDAWIEDVFVRGAARGRGLGRALVEAAMERARLRGCKRIELDVDEGNAPARTLYEALGFSDDLKAEVRSLLLGRRLAP